jgi:hypothetical protein
MHTQKEEGNVVRSSSRAVLYFQSLTPSISPSPHSASHSPHLHAVLLSIAPPLTYSMMPCRSQRHIIPSPCPATSYEPQPQPGRRALVLGRDEESDTRPHCPSPRWSLIKSRAMQRSWVWEGVGFVDFSIVEEVQVVGTVAMQLRSGFVPVECGASIPVRYQRTFSGRSIRVARVYTLSRISRHKHR